MSQVSDRYAAQFNNREYPFKPSQDELLQLVKDNCIVVFGCSDDLCEIMGAWSDEVGCYDANGDEVRFDSVGVIPRWESIIGDGELTLDEARNYIKRLDEKSNSFQIWWCDDFGYDEGHEYSFTYTADFPHSTFDIIETEDNEVTKYCRGMVIDLNEVFGDK